MDKPDGLNKADSELETNKAPDSGNGGPAPTNGDSGDLPVKIPAGGVVAGFSGGGFPSGLFTSGLGLNADVSKKMLGLAPSFGTVLLSIGTGVAESQSQLDKGLVETAKHLSETNIDVITEVIQVLDDDGLPDVAQSTLTKSNVALINFVSPTVHEWKHVALSMDLSVGAMDNESGMSFNQTQIKSGGSGYYVWGFGGWFNADYQQSSQAGFTRTEQESNWASGQMRLDAMLGPRATTKFPIPAEVTLGPSINFSQGSIQETKTNNVVTGRALEVLISVRKADGSVNPTVPLDADTDVFAFSWISDSTFGGSTTNSQGQAKLKVTRDIPSPSFGRPAKVKLTVRLGSIVKELEVII
ncbi:MAG TPA: hypothetical protein VLL54_13600 [Pyrinomonadaceae bacterium]|nr:hypothetical protein [Pyrinomonadaceae bacterium]